MPGMPVAWEGVQNQTSSRRAFQLDMFRSVKPAKSRRAGRRAYFLSGGFKAVQGTLGMTGPLPSTNLIFAACMRALTPTTSKTPSC